MKGNVKLHVTENHYLQMLDLSFRECGSFFNANILGSKIPVVAWEYPAYT